MLKISSDLPLQTLLKRFALIYLPIVIVLSLILLSGMRFDEQLRARNTVVREESRIEVAKGRVTHDLSSVGTDLRVIANLPLMHAYLDSGNPAQRKELEEVFLVLARETHRYDQMRYLDAKGQEVIRINYNDGKPAVVPRRQLQNKSDRYYFSDTLKLNQGEIFVSPLDLNIEHGSLEIPYKPMIRYGTPVFDGAGRKKGIILLNYLGDELLQDFRAVMQGGIQHDSMLLNRDGYWLSGVNREDEWGFMLGKTERTFGHDFPEVWRTISASEQGSVLTDQGLFVYTTVTPLQEEQHSSAGSAVAHSHNRQIVVAQEHHWKIVSFVPHAVLLGTAFYTHPLSRILLVTVYLLLAFAAYFVSRVTLGRKMAQREIAQLNIELEKRVAAHAAGEENLSVTLRSIGDGVLTTDAAGRVTRLNTIAEQLTGWSQAEAGGRPVAEVFHIINQKTRQPSPNPVAATLAQGVIHGLADDTLLVARDGSECPIADSCAPIRDRDGNVTGAVLVFRDVTREYAAEELLHQAIEKAEKANRAKDSFLATMSHEIRTPLTGMLGMLEMLSLTALDREQTETLNAAWSSGRSLLRIVSDILDWSKIEDGKLALSPRATSIPRLLQEVVNTYSRVASAKSLVLRQHADARLSPAHIVDPLRLSQVLNNFVSNAIKFTESGQVELSAELLEQVESGERIRFSVKDSGIGIDKEAQQHLFKRYRQESADTARMYGGTGLGLSICRRLVDLMDGQIELASEPGQGSTFSITLVLPVSGAPGEELQIQHHELEHKTIAPLLDYSADAPLILAVDDHPINRDLLARQIRLLGLRAETAENGKVALTMWREGRFALVITDCHMPEMDGYALSRAIRKIEAEERLPRTPIIAWTANALAGEEDHCQAAGMDEVLVKPADLSQLKKMLAKILSIVETDTSQPVPPLPEPDSARITGPIDYGHLKQIVPDRAGQIKVLHDFQSHIRADLDKLLEIVGQGDHVNTERTAHRMKGSSRMVGATDIAGVCETIESAAGKEEADGVHAGMTALIDAIRQFETHLVGMK